MKKFILVGLLFTFLPLGASSLPDHFIFRAMEDEMQRTVQKMHIEGNPRPHYIVYKVERSFRPSTVWAVSGETSFLQSNAPRIMTSVLLSAGNDQQDSFGTEGNYWSWWNGKGNNYDDVRHGLWDSTNDAYLRASRLYRDKQSYLRKKETQQSFPDFVAGPQGAYMDEVTTPIAWDMSKVEALAKRLSAKGDSYPFIKRIEVWLNPGNHEIFWLNNLGAYAYTNTQLAYVDIDLFLRTKDGFEEKINRSWYMNAQDPQWEQVLEKQVEDMVKNVQKMYNAKEGSAYIGPVLLTAPAAAQVWQEAFTKNMSEFGTLISADGSEKKGGSFKDKIGLRVVSPALDVYDKPLLRIYDHQILSGFFPIDDEGVVPQELTLIKDGFLREIPTSSRPFKEGVRTNGHGFAWQEFPREHLTNVVVEPHQPLSQEDLEQKLLEKCRDQGLEYGYILHGLNNKDNGVALAERIYVADGHKEPIRGLHIETSIGPRLLRDIRAAGDKKSVWRTNDFQAILSPALLLEEMELIPTNKKPDRKPFVPKP